MIKVSLSFCNHRILKVFLECCWKRRILFVSSVIHKKKIFKIIPKVLLFSVKQKSGKYIWTHFIRSLPEYWVWAKHHTLKCILYYFHSIHLSIQYFFLNTNQLVYVKANIKTKYALELYNLLHITFFHPLFTF